MDAQGLLERLDSDGIDHLQVIYHDYSGRAGAKTVPKENFASAVERGVVFARANLDFTLDNHQADGAAFLAHTGDFMAVPDPSSYAVLPQYERAARVHSFMRNDDGSPWQGCPRTRLADMLDRFAAKDLGVRIGLEPEVILFEPNEAGEYRPIESGGMFSLESLDRCYPFWQGVIDTLRDMGVEVEQLGKEYGPGQYEGTPRYGEPLKAIDDYLTYKEVVRGAARRAGMVATFMPKPYAHLPGSGMHVHLSLWDREGTRELSTGETDDAPLSALGSHFVAGLLDHARALVGVGSPIVNSYKRLQPGSWAPAHVCWGVGNRAALVRIPGMGDRRHIEFRSGDNAANPFIFVTALLAAGLDGIEHGAAPPAPVTEDVGHLSTEAATAMGLTFLPRALHEALDAVEADAVIAEALGPVVFGEFLKVKRAEGAAYDLHVHPWEREIYLEAL